MTTAQLLRQVGAAAVLLGLLAALAVTLLRIAVLPIALAAIGLDALADSLGRAAGLLAPADLRAAGTAP